MAACSKESETIVISNDDTLESSTVTVIQESFILAMLDPRTDRLYTNEPLHYRHEKLPQAMDIGIQLQSPHLEKWDLVNL